MCYINTPAVPPYHPQAGGFSYCPHCGRSLFSQNDWGSPKPFMPYPVNPYPGQQYVETSDEMRNRILAEHEKMKARVQSGQLNAPTGMQLHVGNTPGPLAQGLT